MCTATVVIVFALLCFFTNTSKCSRILGVFPSPGYSQFILAERLMTALADRGHEVTVISPFEPDVPVYNYKTISTPGVVNIIKALEIDRYGMENRSNLGNMLKTYITLGLTMTEFTLAEPKVQQLIQSNTSFDLVIVEQFLNEAHLGFANHFKAPLVIFSSLRASEWTNHLVGNPANPSYISNIYSGYCNYMNLWQRIRNLFFYMYDVFLKEFYLLPKQNELLHKYFPNAPHLGYIMYNVSVVLLNSHPSVTETTPLVANMIEIGGFHIAEEPIPKKLSHFLNSATAGAVYFSMGTNLRSKDLSKEKRQIFLDIFSNLKQKVLWKFEDETLLQGVHNVEVAQWIPQRAVLGHPNVKAFVSHCGLISVIESVYFGVPLVCIPIFGDQKMNAAVASKNGIAVELQLKELSKERLTNALNKVLYNQSYTWNVKRKSSLMHDRPLSPMDTAIYWIEYVIRHRGATHLQTAALQLGWHQYLFLDVAALFFFTLVTLWHLFKYFLQLVCGKKSICNLEKPKKE